MKFNDLPIGAIFQYKDKSTPANTQWIKLKEKEYQRGNARIVKSDWNQEGSLVCWGGGYEVEIVEAVNYAGNSPKEDGEGGFDMMQFLRSL